MSLLRSILNNEGLTRGLGDPEARMLVEWLVEQVEALARKERGAVLQLAVAHLCRRARALARFVSLWSDRATQGAACQLAATERFPWPLPRPDCDPCDLMHDILQYEASLIED